MKDKPSLKVWWESGSPWIWLNAAAVSISMIMVIGLLLLIAVRGLQHFWPPTVYELRYAENQAQERIVIGSIRDSEEIVTERLRESGLVISGNAEFTDRHLLKIGNRDSYGSDFTFIIDPWIEERR
ncbi:MAG: phosphate ABC transporter, permease protein PstA, partial [Gammaproteobacteria bacterium]|nr:phosphate ABC transporter, permease protein PstA [Gammaproteobacteria bacterium]